VTLFIFRLSCWLLVAAVKDRFGATPWNGRYNGKESPLIQFSASRLYQIKQSARAIFRTMRDRLGILTRGPGERASAEEMDVKVEDGLSCARAHVQDRPVSLLDVPLARDVRGGQVAAAN
jgi:hypothetical protein